MDKSIPLLYEFQDALLSLDRLAVKRIISESRGSESPIHNLEELIVNAFEQIGKGWEEGKVSLAQVYMSGRICEELIDTILPPGGLKRKHQPRMAIAVLDDYHLLGKRIVYSILRASGFELLDYGHGITAEELVKRVCEDRVEVLFISVLMLASALGVKDLRRMLAERDIHAKIIVGGAPFRFDSHLWKEVGADDIGLIASDAIAILDRIMGASH
jgi:methanogenic corrinoid protein MtbC1